MTGECLDYFSDWSEAEETLSRIVDQLSPMVWYEATRKKIVVKIAVNDSAIPERYARLFYALLNGFFTHYFSIKRFERQFDDRLTERFTDIIRIKSEVELIKLEVERIMNVPLDGFGMPVRDCIKGIMGIHPYRLRIPDDVHALMTGIATLERLGRS